jgi:hypothetical protein
VADESVVHPRRLSFLLGEGRLMATLDSLECTVHPDCIVTCLLIICVWADTLWGDLLNYLDIQLRSLA